MVEWWQTEAFWFLWMSVSRKIYWIHISRRKRLWTRYGLMVWRFTATTA